MSSYQRIDRISEEVRREVDAIIREELGDLFWEEEKHDGPAIRSFRGKNEKEG